MKLKENFVLRQIADTWVVFPHSATTVNFNGMLSLNEAGTMLWRHLEKGADREALADALIAEYDVSRKDALADVDEFLNKLVQFGCAEA